MSAERGGSQRAEELLRQADFVRRLARSLLCDVHLAEDVAQDALAAGLVAPPPRGPSLRAWLAGVVRNRVKMELRGGGRRERRERAAPARRDALPPDEIVARLETSRRVVDAVLALDEPYRSVIVLRYLDDLPPAEIARRTGVPLDTVKTRLRRALDRLRAGMDGVHPRGGRSEWTAALLPLAAAWDTGPGWGATLLGGTAMAAKSKAAAIVAAVLFGVLVGALGREAVSIAARAPATPDGPSASAPATETARRAGPARTAAEGGAADTARAARAGAAPAQVVIPVPPPLPRTGTGIVTGRVATADGAPISGAFVAATPGADTGFGAPDVDPRREFADWAGATARAEARRRARGGAATSGPDGSYAIAGLGDSGYHVTATHPSYDLDPAGRSDGRWVRAGGKVDFTGVPVARVRVDVLAPTGEPVDEAVVVLRGDALRDRPRVTWTPDEPEVRMRPGAWTVQAFARNGDLRSAAERVDVVPGSAPSPLVLRLQPARGLRGRVLDAPAGERGFVFVHLLRIGSGESADDARTRLLRAGTRAPTFAVTDFRYRFDDLEPGRYVVGASLMGGDLLVADEVTVASAPVTHDLVVPERTAEEFLEVRVLGPDGKRLAEADVAVAVGAWVPPRGVPSEGVEHRTDGRILVRRTIRQGQSELVRLVVRTQSYGEREIPFDPKAPSPIEVRFDAPSALDVTVSGADAPEVRGAVSLHLQPSAAGSARAKFVFDTDRKALDATGTHRFPALQPGEYELSLYVGRPGGPHARRFAIERVSVRAGENRTTLTLPRFGSLRVEVPGAEAGQDVALSALPGGPPLDPESQKTDAEGRARFDLLPPGRYQLRATVGGRLLVATAELPNDTVATLSPVGPPPNAR